MCKNGLRPNWKRFMLMQSEHLWIIGRSSSKCLAFTQWDMRGYVQLMISCFVGFYNYISFLFLFYFRNSTLEVMSIILQKHCKERLTQVCSKAFDAFHLSSMVYTSSSLSCVVQLCKAFLFWSFLSCSIADIPTCTMWVIIHDRLHRNATIKILLSLSFHFQFRAVFAQFPVYHMNAVYPLMLVKSEASQKLQIKT